jgi:16S rRNA (cytidine1402-2'-O)-methyltransferase
VRPKIIQYLQEKEAISLISDAGTPLLADPGFKLVQECQTLGINVTAVPGASALLPSIILSGFAVVPFAFIGFANKLNQKALENLQNCSFTLVFFESPHKLVNTINLFSQYFGNRQIAIVREITKIHEEVVKGSFNDVLCHFLNETPRGECVIVLSHPAAKIVDDERVKLEIKSALQTMSIKDAAEFVSQKLKMSKHIVYQFAIKMQSHQRNIT